MDEIFEFIKKCGTYYLATVATVSSFTADPKVVKF